MVRTTDSILPSKVLVGFLNIILDEAIVNAQYLKIILTRLIRIRGFNPLIAFQDFRLRDKILFLI
jgi:hypothetical protein